MDSATVATLRSSFASLAARKADVATIFYDRLFERAPSVRPLFKPDLADQKQKLMAALVQIVAWVDQPEQLGSHLANLGKRHVGYGAKPEHYDVVGETLFWTFERILGPDFTPTVRAAWVSAYTAVATRMREAAASVDSGPAA